MRAHLWFAAAAVSIVLVCGLVLAIPFSSVRERQAIAASGGVALVVQLAAFAMARRVAGPRRIEGWILGAGLRFATVILYGTVAVKALHMPAPAVLISLVTFLFASTLVESKLLTI